MKRYTQFLKAHFQRNIPELFAKFSEIFASLKGNKMAGKFKYSKVAIFLKVKG